MFKKQAINPSNGRVHTKKHMLNVLVQSGLSMITPPGIFKLLMKRKFEVYLL